jgi:hypothetical protein
MTHELKPRPQNQVCSDCDALTRRDFLGTVGRSAAAAGASALLGGALASAPSSLAAAAQPPAGSGKPAETFVKMLYDSLKEEQRKLVLFPFDHPKRGEVSNNWHIVDPATGAIGKLYNSDQKELLRQILKGVTSEDGFERFSRQMKDDAGGFEEYTCAIFGEPGTKAFEWVMTGRHLTIRADGNSVENTAFGGPIFYGHAVKFDEEPDHPGNVWWPQARLANKVYAALDGKQKAKALLEKDPPDSAETVRLRGAAELPGIAVSELSADQKQLVEETIQSMLAMYRKSDVDEVIECLKANGGLESLRMSFYKEGDLGADGIWDRWRLEGPAFVWYFRGSPHVHTWVHVAHKATVASAARQGREAVEGVRRARI